MFSIPSSRKLANTTLILATTLLFAWLVVQVHRIVVETITTTDRITLRNRQDLRSAIDFKDFTSLEHYFVQQYHDINNVVEPNKQVVTHLSQCRNRPNPHTNHIRLSSVKILNISMVPSSDFAPEFVSNKYFNPASISLPSHVYTTSGYRYLLVSRLVTSGHHQESHICFADICSAEVSSSHSNRPCTASDLDFLGPQGGLRCITKPVKVNIPPTPSRKCTGAWSTFPDIPGFHDPRIFWSGRGEPLIEVNSGSQYGCVGLWLQDLRPVYPILEQVLAKREKGLGIREIDERDGKRQITMDLVGLGPPIGYPHLTEITKNPRNSRSEVEKNWVLFFPSEEETWVQYDMMGKANLEEKSGHHSHEPTSTNIKIDSKIHMAFGAETATIVSVSITAEEVEAEGKTSIQRADTTSTSLDSDQRMHSEALNTKDANVHEASMTIEPELKKLLLEDGPAKREEAGNNKETTFAVHGPTAAQKFATSIESIIPQMSNSPELAIFHDAAGNANVTTTFITPDAISTHLTMATASSSTKLISTGGRSLAQLLSYGHTTPNLTSPLELPCFNLTDHSHQHDKFNNTGHWHQGSNSLRLIFCARERFRARSCSSAESGPLEIESRGPKDLGWADYEEFLVKEGLVVHFSIIHRKFNNAWDLPMRYERYLLVWEARKPFRTLGVSQHPVLFGEERARPWTVAEDLGLREEHPIAQRSKRSISNESMKEMQDDDPRGAAYFTYTPSIAWAWRLNSDEGAAQERGHEDLGTGYLGEDIIVGIGMDDMAQGFVKMGVDELLSCLRLCPI